MLSIIHYRSVKIITTALTMTILFLSSFIISSCSRSESPVPSKQDNSLKHSGPLIEKEYTKISPIDEIGANAGSLNALSEMGDQYFESGKYVEAIAIYKKVIVLDPENVDAYNDMGLAYQYLNQPDKAIETLRKGTEIMPSYQRIWISLGFVLVSTGTDAEARTALSKAVELGPDTPVGKEAQRLLNQIK